MEHYRSTLGTAAVACIGLLVAARVLHPGNFEELPGAARPVPSPSVAASASAAARVDPPFDLYLRPSALSSEMAVMAPRLTEPLPAGMTMMPILPAAMATAVDQPRENGARRRPGVAERVVHAKPAAVWRARTAQASSTVTRSTSAETHEAPRPEPARDDEG